MKYKKLNENAKVPTRADNGAAGYDLYATNTDTITINPHQTVMVGTGLAMEIPIGLFGAVFARSGMASKRSLRPANCVGVGDSSYRGELIVSLHNDSDEPQYVEPGERVAQLVFLQNFLVNWEEVDELSETDRGTGGFGSSGTK
jgi:dUTP pyrophosphatase